MLTFLGVASRRIVFLLASLLLVSTVGADEMRTWTDSTGKFKVRAKFDSIEGEKVVLLRENGSKLKIALEKLSQADLAYIALQKANNPFEADGDGGDAGSIGLGNSASRNMGSGNSESGNSESGGNQVRPTRIDWTASKQVSLIPADSTWKVTVTPAAASGSRPKSVPLPPKIDFFEEVSGIVYNASGKAAVVGCGLKRPGNEKATLRLLYCDLEGGRVSGIRGAEGEMIPLALHDDGRQVLMRRNEFGFGKADRLELWGTQGKALTRKLVWTPYDQEQERDVSWAAFLSGDKLVTNSKSGNLVIWDLSSGQPLCHFQASIERPAISPDRKYIAFICEKDLGLFDIEKQEVIATQGIPDRLSWANLMFSPSGNKIACFSMGRILLWDTATGKLEKDFTISGISGHNGVAFPDEGFLMVGDLLIELSNQLILWEYQGASHVQSLAGTTFMAVFDHNQPGVLLSAKIPHPEATAALKKALTQPDLFVFRKGSPVRLDVSALPDPNQQNTVREVLTKKLGAMNCPIQNEAPVSVVAYVDGPKSREISYMHAGTFQVQEYLAKLKIDYQGATVWETQWTNVPGFLHLKQGENVGTVLSNASQGPSYKGYETVELPQFLQKPSGNPQQGGGRSIGGSKVTNRGLR